MDISVILDRYKFNYRVACIIQNKDKILLHKNKEDIFYALPGGRVKIGENSISALKREFMEEIEFVWKKKCEIKDLEIRPKCLKENIDNINKTFHVINNME